MAMTTTKDSRLEVAQIRQLLEESERQQVEEAKARRLANQQRRQALDAEIREAERSGLRQLDALEGELREARKGFLAAQQRLRKVQGKMALARQTMEGEIEVRRSQLHVLADGRIGDVVRELSRLHGRILSGPGDEKYRVTRSQFALDALRRVEALRAGPGDLDAILRAVVNYCGPDARGLEKFLQKGD